jgi:hypothetical protein
MELQQVKIVDHVRNGNRIWYVIPNELYKEFFNDQDEKYMVDTGRFEDKYRKYMTNGCMNEIQLYAEIK